MSAKYTFAVYGLTVGSAKEKLVLLKLADNSNDNGVCWPAMGYLQKHTELTRSSLLRALKSLEEKGFIQVTRRKTEDGKQNLSNVYQLTLPSFTVELPQSHSDTTPSVIVTPKPNNIKSKKESIKYDVFLNAFNSIINNNNPNWQKCQSLSDSRKNLIKKALVLVKPRSKECQETEMDYLIRLIEAMAMDDDFFSGRPTARNPNGYNCRFETNLSQDRIAQAIDKFAGETA